MWGVRLLWFFHSSALLTCSLTTVVTMLNECQNNERRLSCKRLPWGLAEPDAISLKFLQCPNENKPKIRFRKTEWLSGQPLHRNQMLESFTGVIIIFLYFPRWNFIFATRLGIAKQTGKTQHSSRNIKPLNRCAAAR